MPVGVAFDMPADSRIFGKTPTACVRAARFLQLFQSHTALSVMFTCVKGGPAVSRPGDPQDRGTADPWGRQTLLQVHDAPNASDIQQLRHWVDIYQSPRAVCQRGEFTVGSTPDNRPARVFFLALCAGHLPCSRHGLPANPTENSRPRQAFQNHRAHLLPYRS